MKDTNEFAGLATGLVDSFFQSTQSDGFDFKTDFQNFVDDLLKLQPGLQGLKNVPSELNVANQNEDIGAFEDVRQTGTNSMPNVPDMTRYHINNVFMGIVSGIALGQKNGREQLIEELKNGTVSIEDLV